MGIYNPLKNVVVAARNVQNTLPVDRLVDWPTVIFLTVEPPVDRAKPVGRPPGRPASTPELGAFSWLTARSTSLLGWPVHVPRAHRSTDPVD